MIVFMAFTALSFGLVWHIWWLAIVSAALVPTAFIMRSFMPHQEKIIPAAQVEREHKAWLALIADSTPITRDQETSMLNRGLAAVETAS